MHCLCNDIYIHTCRNGVENICPSRSAGEQNGCYSLVKRLYISVEKETLMCNVLAATLGSWFPVDQPRT